MAILEKIISYIRTNIFSTTEPLPAENIDTEDYDTLTPKIITGESVQEYFSVLDFAFSKRDVKNIAITGPYGAGKSTVILSYLSTQNKSKYINVSLADFSMSGKSMSEGAVEQSQVSPNVELSILQQILYKENKDNLPDSRIDRIQNRDEKHIRSLFCASLSIMLPIAFFIATVFTKMIFPLLGASNETVTFLSSHFLSRLVLSSFFGLLIIYCVVRVASKAGLFDKKLKLSKIAFLQGSADLSTQESSSLLNNCLDEIVYFFSKSDYKIVVFEDLDRLGNSEVFVKLREINQIINNNIRGNPVRFVYACRDDIFLGADVRTKFFDFILPIIPVMDAKNSFTHLKNKIKSFPLHHMALLKQTSLYIGDMRSLQNIANEFNLFKKVVDGNKEEDKLFALVFYKNIYAQDYNLTDKKSGVLYSLINDYRKRLLHEEYFESLDLKERLLLDKLEKLKVESASSALKVRKEIICRFISVELWPIVQFGRRVSGYANLYTVSNAQALIQDESIFVQYFSSTEQSYIGYSANNQFVPIVTSNVIEEYDTRSKLVSSDREMEYKKTLIEIDEIKESIRIRNTISLAELLKKIGEGKFKEITERYIENSNDPDIIDPQQCDALSTGFRLGGLEILYFLLVNGYIMQDFMMFRSIFNEGAISANDNEYIKAVGRFSDFQHVNDEFLIDDVKEVISQLLEQNYIVRQGAFHHQIVAYLQENSSRRNDEILSGVISRIFDMSPEQIYSLFAVFDGKFIDPASFKRFTVLTLEKPGSLDKMISVLEGREKSILETNLAVTMIAFVDPRAASDRERYREFIERRGYSLLASLTTESLSPFMENIMQAGVKYEGVTLPVTPIDSSALKYVTDNALYVFNKENYRVAVAGLLQAHSITCEQVDDRPYSLVKNHQLTQIASYLEENMDRFVHEIFLGSQEDSATIVSILNHSAVSDASRIDILKEMRFTVDSLDAFAEDVHVDEEGYSYHDLFFRYGHVEPGWTVLLDFIFNDYNMGVFTEYVESHAERLSQLTVETTDADDLKLLYAGFICNNGLTDAAYAFIIKTLPIDVKLWDEHLSPLNFMRIILSGKLVLTPDVFEQVTGRFGILASDAETDAFLTWFRLYKTEFLANSVTYLRADEEVPLLEGRLTAITRSSEFTAQEKSMLLLKHYKQCSESFLAALGLARDVMLSLIALSDDDSLKIALIIRLIEDGYAERADIAALTATLHEKELTKLFCQKTATLTFKTTPVPEALFPVLLAAGLLKKWSRRENGQYEIICCPESESRLGL